MDFFYEIRNYENKYHSLSQSRAVDTKIMNKMTRQLTIETDYGGSVEHHQINIC